MRFRNEDSNHASRRGGLLLQAGVLILFPIAVLSAYWAGGERGLLISALGLPLLLGSFWMFRFQSADRSAVHDAASTRILMPHVIAMLDRFLRDSRHSGRPTACVVLRLDEMDRILSRHGLASMAEILTCCRDRLVSFLRSGDRVALLPDGGIAVALQGERRLDLESLIQLSSRLQAALSAGIRIDAMTHYVTVSVGFCLGDRAPESTGESLLEAATLAAQEAYVNGPAAIRAFTPDIAKRQADRSALRGELESALDEGHIRPHFQPQISTDTGQITGFEALARWHHPVRGILPPSEFLPAIEQSGLSERLGEAIMFRVLNALASWDKAGFSVPSVGVNFSADELRNPLLPERLKWELDRFGLSADRISVEILETVVAQTENDVVVKNVAALARMGCGIDLDDFGTGNASITSIRRFDVRRIKIDRSFVTRVDSDREQQKMISAVISLADRLDLETLAEGVETGAELAMLGQLGCRHVQGFGIGRPLPFEETEAWMTAHLARAADLPDICRKAVGG